MNATRIPAHAANAVDDGNDDAHDVERELEHDGPLDINIASASASSTVDATDDEATIDPENHARRTQRAQDAPGSGRLARRTERAQDAEPKAHHYDARQRPRRTQRAQDAESVPHPHSDDTAIDASS